MCLHSVRLYVKWGHVQLHVPSSLRVTVYSTPGFDSLGTRQLLNLARIRFLL
jgi:hypothetical protein